MPQAQHPILQSNDVLGIFFQSLEQQMNSSMLSDLTFRAESTHSAGESYAWLGNVKGVREWIGPRNTQSLSEYSFFIQNKRWEDTLVIKDDDYRFDKLGQIKARCDELALTFALHPLQLLTSLIVGGESALCYDSQYFYSATHSEGASGTQSNLISVDISELPIPADAHGSTTNPSAQELEKVILLMIQQMLSFKNDVGNPINQTARNFVLHVPISMMAAALAAVGNTTFANGQINTLAANKSRFNVTVLTDPMLTWTTKLALHRVDPGVKAFIYQEAIPIGMRNPITYGSEHHTINNEHLFPADGMYNLGYGLWQQSVLASLT